MFYNCHDQMVFINMYSCQYVYIYTLQKKMKLSIKDFFSKCDQICKKLWIWSNLLKKSLMENFIFCVVKIRTLFINASVKVLAETPWRYL